jgi:hypothetical protein
MEILRGRPVFWSIYFSTDISPLRAVLKSRLCGNNSIFKPWGDQNYVAMLFYVVQKKNCLDFFLRPQRHHVQRFASRNHYAICSIWHTSHNSCGYFWVKSNATRPVFHPPNFFNKDLYWISLGQANPSGCVHFLIKNRIDPIVWRSSQFCWAPLCCVPRS